MCRKSRHVEVFSAMFDALINQSLQRKYAWKNDNNEHKLFLINSVDV